MKTAAQLIAFEEKVKALWEDGELPYLIHLSGGNEQQLLDVFSDVQLGDWVFGSHRSHYHALLSGMSEIEVLDAIYRGDSMFMFSKQHRFYSSSILAGTCGIAVGVAMALKAKKSSNRVWCFIGDGAEEQGHFYEAVLYATGHNLPVTFIIEDNAIQVDTAKVVRRGMSSGLLDSWPCVMRYHYTPRWPHAGSGTPKKIIFKRTTP